jgi:hypothetical protein
MEKKQDTRPFNLEHARAGAPIACANGEKVEILKWDRKHDLCIIGLGRDDTAIRQWRADGSYLDPHSKAFTLVMTPLGHIDGKPVFTGDEIELKCMAKPDEWKRVKAEPGWAGTWNDDGSLARWPAPAKQYPQCQMDYLDLTQAALQTNSTPTMLTGSQALAIANAALRHAVDVGQVIPLDQHVREIGEAISEQGRVDRAARDMAIATAVLCAVKTVINSYSTGCLHYVDGKIDLPAIIAKVKP